MSPSTLIRASMLLALSTATACSTSSSGARPGDAGDAGTVDDASDDVGIVGDGAGGTVCGPPPYVSIQLTVRGISTGSDGGDGPPIQGAILRASVCPEIAVATLADGTINTQVTKSTPLFAHFTAANYASTVISGMQFDADKSGMSVTLPPSLFTALIPGYDATKPTAIVGVMKNGGTGACDALDGVSFAVTGHPEAQITYFSADSIPQPTTGTVTTTAGRAVILGLAAGPPVTMTATKAGCTINFAKDPYTGSVPLEPGFLTLVPAYIN